MKNEFTSDTVKNMNLDGKTAVVTGATAGVGFCTVLLLAKLGAYVIGIGRSKEKCKKSMERIKKVCPLANVEYILCDLSSQRQIRKTAGKIKEKAGNSIDALINDAGMVSSWFMTTEDGIEQQFAVNYLASFLLTHELMPLLNNSSQGRVVMMSSGSHYRMRLNFKDLQMRYHYSCLMAYKQTKLADMMFTLELNRRLGVQSNVKAIAVDPGLVSTEIGLKNTCGIEKLVWKWRMKGGTTPDVPAVTVVFAAFEPSLSKNENVYWKNLSPLIPSRYAKRKNEAVRLWDMSKKLCNIV